MDDGTPRRHESVKVFTCFLQPNGKVHHFHIPFHVLSMSSTAEKDINTQTKVFALAESKDSNYLEEILKLLQEIRNLHLRISVIQKLLSNEQLGLSDSLSLLSSLNEATEMNSQEFSAKSMELKIYCNRLVKLYHLLKLFNDCTSKEIANDEDTENEQDNETLLANCLGLNADKLEPLVKLLEDSSEENKQLLSLNLSFSAFLSSFDTEGELMKTGKLQIGLRKDIQPEVKHELGKLFCHLCSLNNARDVLTASGVSLSEIFETVLISAVTYPLRSAHWFTNLSKCFVTLLSVREGSDDKSVSSMQELSKRILLKAKIDEDLYAVIFLWMNGLQQVDAPQTYVDDWSRRLHQTSAMVELIFCYRSLLPKTASGPPIKLNYSLQSVYDSGNGRMSEIVSSWLHKLGSCSLNIPSAIDGFNETNELALVTKVGEFFPKCMDVNILVAHMCWEELQGWCQKDRNDLDVLETALLSLSSISCTKLKVMFSHLIWRTFFSKLFRDIVKRTDDFKKSTMNESNICDKEFGLKRENIATFLQLIQGFLDKSLELLRFGELPDVHVEYDNYSLNNQKHLIDHTLSVEPPDIDILSLEHQFSVVLCLTWRLKLPSRPLKLFNSIEINNLLKTNTTAVVSWFSDYNTSVRSERIAWTELVSETAAGYIHRLPDAQLDATVYKELMEPLLEISKVWYLSDVVKVGQCHALYVTGFDSLGGEIRDTFTSVEMGRLSEKLLDVALLRIAKYLHQVFLCFKVLGYSKISFMSVGPLVPIK